MGMDTSFDCRLAQPPSRDAVLAAMRPFDDHAVLDRVTPDDDYVLGVDLERDYDGKIERALFEGNWSDSVEALLLMLVRLGDTGTSATVSIGDLTERWTLLDDGEIERLSGDEIEDDEESDLVDVFGAA